MIPNSLIELAMNPPQNDRGSPELRAYVRREWHAEIAWLVRLFSRETVGSTIRGLLRELTARPRNKDGEAGPARPQTLRVDARAAEDCPHPVVEDLGFGGPASFLRCALCGGVLILHAGRRWSVSPVEPAAWEETPDG